MSKHLLHLRLMSLAATAGMLLSGCDTLDRGLQTQRLPSCSAENSIFADMQFNGWNELYHRQVNAVIEAHMKTMKNIGQEPLRCTDKDFSARIPATRELQETASMIPAWADRTGELTESDMQTVLLEFLRVYECSMDEHILFLPVILSKNAPILRGAYTDQMTDIRAEVEKEKTIARESLNRTLSLVSGFDRLQPLTLDIECLKRSSLDLRNVLGLASDAVSCLPRIWDAKGSLRDLAQ
jgi:hypothetical protein